MSSPRTEDSEIDLDGFFHHPSWPEPWSHSEFTVPNVERHRRWETQPWYHQNRAASDLITRSFDRSWPWGYMIYRTVYTPQSDECWSAAMAKLDRYMHHSIDANAGKDGDPYPERLIHESYRNVVLHDKDQFDGASIEQVREHFNQWRPDRCHFNGFGRYNMCLMVDEKALLSLVRSVEPGVKEFGDPPGYCILTDPEYDGGSYCNPGYRGFMRVEVCCLWDLYYMIGTYSLVDELCPHIREGQIPFYDGSYGASVNEDGEVIERHPRRRFRRV